MATSSRSSSSEATNAIQRQELLLTEAEDLFYQLDKDGNGKLDLGELRELLLLMLPAGGSEAHVEKLLQQAFSSADANHDGWVSFDEFIQYHNQLVDEVQYMDDEFEEDEADAASAPPAAPAQPTQPPAAPSGPRHGRRGSAGAPPPPPPPPPPDATLDALGIADDGVARPAAPPPWELITLDALQMGERLGGGGMGAVHGAFWQGEPVAVKTMHDTSAAQLAAVEAELRIHAELSSHAGVVRLFGANLRPPGCCIVMERCERSLFELLHRDADTLERRQLVAMALEVSAAMGFLHSRAPPVVHRDLKSHNVLLGADGRCRLCDFGLVGSREVTAGTPNYMAPELFLAKAYSTPVDVFAFGVLLNELFTREVPWDGYQPLDIKDKVVEGQRPRTATTTPRACESLLHRCWHGDAKLRPPFEQVEQTLRDIQDSLPMGSSALLGVGGIDALDDFAALR